MDILYLDLWFGLNWLCDYLLCLLTARAAGLFLRRRRYRLCALLGALFATLSFLPGFSFLCHPLWKLAFGFLIGYTAFHTERSPLSCILLFFLISSAFGGALILLSPPGGHFFSLSLRAFLLSFLFCYALGALLFRCRTLLTQKKTCSVIVIHQGRKASFQALLDTGNSLRDPLTGSPVLLASPRALQNLLSQESIQIGLSDPVTLVSRSRNLPEFGGKLRLIPYTAVGGTGLLPAFRPDSLMIDGETHGEFLVALSPQVVGDGFEAIL